MKAIFKSLHFKTALLLPFLVYEVMRERNYYHTHGEFSTGTILVFITFATMIVASIIYWLVSMIGQRIGKHHRP